ncbi:hypothetical protein BHM03_00038306 [Ensete ventricosum]|nr:hypothetical protein BHM03_00038306 [Ensete ventricosum]
MSSRIAGSRLLRHLGPRLFFSTASARAPTAGEPACSLLLSGSASLAPARPPAAVLVRLFPVRMTSTTAAQAFGGEQEGEAKPSAGSREATAVPPSERMAVASYWGIQPSKIIKEDGTPWRWSCFMPWETYKADTSIDLEKHHVPSTLLDKLAYWMVKALRVPTDIFFQVRDAAFCPIEISSSPKNGKIRFPLYLL